MSVIWSQRRRGLRRTLRETSGILSFGFLLCLLFYLDADRVERRPNLISGDHHGVGSRKLLDVASSEAGGVAGRTTEQTGAATCSRDDILVYQGATPPLPNGIPTYTVQILNTCPAAADGGCAVSDIHVRCGWFSSARLINPRVFRRLRYDDCLVNDGAPLAPGESLSFQYANTFRYPLYVSSVNCS